VLHGLGRRKGSFWDFHWHEHHAQVRQNDHLDPDYERSLLGWHAQTKEALGLLAAGVAHLPLLPVAPFFTGAVWFSLVRYYRVHKRAHLDPAWAKDHLPWHYDHHMGPDQDANWCVSRPWADVLFGTRAPYLGTERHERDEAKRRALAARKAKAAAAKARVAEPSPA
jgi:sterol desaturase/sphingolipid hydroxylase (fatty acid hydroxylase superfamily)